MVEPGAAAIAMAVDHVLNKITRDDDRTNLNPDPAIHPNWAKFDLNNLFRCGETLRSASPSAVGGTLKVAYFNFLNYFTNLNSRPEFSIIGQKFDARA